MGLPCHPSRTLTRIRARTRAFNLLLSPRLRRRDKMDLSWSMRALSLMPKMEIMTEIVSLGPSWRVNGADSTAVAAGCRRRRGCSLLLAG